MNDDVKSQIENYKYWDIFESDVQQRSNRQILHDIDDIMNNVTDQVTERAREEGKDVTQTRRTVAGNYFHALVSYATTDVATNNSLRLLHAKETLNNTELAGAIPSFGDGDDDGDETELAPDTDIIYFDPDDEESPVFIISCKTSFRERMTQSALWKIMFSISMYSCSDQNCPTHNFSLSGSFDRDIYMGFATTDFYDSVDSVDVVDLFDFGYVPPEGSSASENVYRMPRLIDHVENGWADFQ